MIVAEVIGALAKVKGASFAGITYRTKETKELSRFLCIVGADTTELYKKDVKVLQAMIPELTGTLKLAAEELLKSRQESLVLGVGFNSQYVHAPHAADTYVYPEGLPGVRVHKEEGTVYLNVLVEDRKVIEPGIEKKPVKSSPLTIAKNIIRQQLPSHRFRQFIIKRVRNVSMSGTKIEADTVEIEAADA